MKPLNPIMAVLVIASVGALPLRTLAGDGKKPVAAVLTTQIIGVPVPIKPEDKDSITRLTEVLNNKSGFPTAVADAGQRVADFLLNPDGQKSFVASDVDKKVLAAVVLDWAKKEKPGDLAMLYFVVGTGATAPKWVSDDKLLAKTVLPQREAEGRLRIKLDRYTDAAAAQIKHSNNDGPDTIEFLKIASKEAKYIFDHPATKVSTDGSIEENNNTAVKPPDTTRPAGSQFDGATQQYTLEDLYVKGAKVIDVSGPDDKNSRKISMKIYSKRLPDGSVVNEIGIYDITDSPKDIFGRRFPMDGDKKFVLDDRTPGHKDYELKFSNGKNGDMVVTFARPGDGGVPLTTTLNDLHNMRADQAAAMRNIVNVGGQEFYVLPQGGSKGALALFPKAMIDNRGGTGDPLDLKPALYAEVGRRGPDGRNENVPPGTGGGPQLGEVGGIKYHLVFNNALKVWEAVEGPGNPTIPPPAKPSGGGSTGGGNPGDGSTGGEEEQRPEGEMAIEDLEKLLLMSPKCTKTPADTALMADRLKDKFSIIACNLTGKPENQQAILLVPAAVKPGQQMIFASILKDDTARPRREAMMLLRGRIVDHYLVLQFEGQVQYLDLDKPNANGFSLEGFVMNKEAAGPPTKDPTAREGMKNMIIFLDALRNYMGVPANSGVFAAVPERAKKVSPDSYDLQAKYAGTQLMAFAQKGKGPQVEIWPEFATAPAGPASGQYAGLSGPTNVMEREVSSVDAPFEAEFPIPNAYLLKLEGSAQKDIALYKAVDPTGKEDPKKYYVSFKYLALDPNEPSKPEGPGTKKIFRQKYFEVFNADNPLPETFGMQGLTTGNPEVLVRGQLAYRFVSGTKRDKGVLVVVQNAQISGEGQKDSASNCVGPLIWWGLANREAALKVCKNDKF